MAAKFEILQPNPGEFRWVLTSQGRVLARSDAYTRKVSCVNAMESFRKAAQGADIVDHTARPARVVAAEPTTVPGKVARRTGRVVGKAAATVAEVPQVAVEAVKKVVDVVTPSPRKRAARTS
jgi:uncharacterized protein YegP (UPF0339 family)